MSFISIRFRLLELTMGCVYSYPLFSFQGSKLLSQQRGLFYQTSFWLSSTFLRTFQSLFCFAAFAATNDILSDFILFVKYFFLYLLTFFACCFRSNEWYLITSFFIRQVLFFVLLKTILLVVFRDNEWYNTKAFSICQH